MRAMRRFPNIGAIILLASLAIAGLAAAVMATTADRGGEISQDVGGRPTPAPIATAQVVHDAYMGEVPDSHIDFTLTEEQIDEVKSVLNSDERLETVLSGESFTVVKTGPWVYNDELTGALVKIDLDNPISYTGYLPGVGIPGDCELESGADYITGEYSARAEGIESLEMLVDLNKRVVASIEIEKATGEVHLDYEWSQLRQLVRWMIAEWICLL